MEKYYKHKCKCGCGNKIKIKNSHRWDGIPQYIHGHYNRGKNYGMIGENHPMYGRKGKDNPNYGQKRPKQSEFVKTIKCKKCGCFAGKNHDCKKIAEKQSRTRKRLISEGKITSIFGKDIKAGWKGKANGMYGRDRSGKNNPMYGKKHKPETIEANRQKQIGNKASNKTKEKMRKSAFEYAKEHDNIICPRIGKHETQILDELEKLFNYKIIRQYQVIGYFLDGYIKELNLAIEVDEIPKINERDIRREKEIKEELNCNVLRIEDRF